jgi:hypothetical protein
MRTSRKFQQIDRKTLTRVIGGADMSGIMQAAGPLMGMIPGIGPIASAIMPMIGQMTAKKSGGSGGADPNAGGAQQQQQMAAAQQQQPQGSAGDDMSQGQQAMPSASGGRHRGVNVSVEIG